MLLDGRKGDGPSVGGDLELTTSELNAHTGPTPGHDHADACVTGPVSENGAESSGLRLAQFNGDTLEALSSHLPATASLDNPVDIIGDAAQDRYENALAAVIRDENVDGALVILTPQSMTNVLGTAQGIVRIARRTHKPILCSFMGIIDVSEGVKYLQSHGIPVFRFPESAAKAFGALYQYSRWLNRQHLAPFKLTHQKDKAAEIIDQYLKQGKTRLGELEGLPVLEAYGFHVLPTRLARTGTDAVQAAESIGYPVVMKIVSEQILHKTDAGGVKVGLNQADEVQAAFAEMVARAKAYRADAQIEGVLIQQMAPSGRETILGANRYRVFGPLIMFGFGGIFVEVFKDVSFRLAPVERDEARRMVREIKGYKLLKAFRGQPDYDTLSIQKALVSLSEMVMNHPQIKELDINPLLVHPEGEGVTVADCRMILAPAQ